MEGRKGDERVLDVGCGGKKKERKKRLKNERKRGLERSEDRERERESGKKETTG